ncbi:DNA repair protein RecO [Xanthomonas sp. Mitacek01]|nr:DNA repair protein RecO [Xanthomonas sp. Mitacek01]
MRIEDEPAFVLHARAWRETSLLVEVLTLEHGRLGLVARGVQGPKKHVLRAALQPLQHVRLSALLRGELAQLRTAEALDVAPRLSGDAMLAGFYVSELVLRLAPRQDPAPELYAAFAEVRRRLPLDGLAWTLRRFERDLLEAIGLGFEYTSDGDGADIDPMARYRLDPEHGPRRLHRDGESSERSTAATGQALLALAADIAPDPADMASLRRALRSVLAHHLGPRGLKSWELAASLSRR